MPEIRVQDEQGNIHVFPDGSTPEMIAKVMNVRPPSSSPTDMANAALAQSGIKVSAPPDNYPVPHEVERFGGILNPGAVTLPPKNRPLPGSFEGKPENVGQDSSLLAIPAQMARDKMQENIDDPNAPKASRMMSAVGQGATDFVEGMAKPSTLATIGGMRAVGGTTSAARLFQKAATIYFGTEMAHGTVSGISDAYDLHKAGNDEGAIRALTNAGFSAVMAADTVHNFSNNRVGTVDDAKQVLQQATSKLNPRGRYAERMQQSEEPGGPTRQEVLDQSREMGVNLDVAQATGSPVARTVKKVGRYSLTGSGTYDAATESNTTALAKAADDAANKMSTVSGKETVGTQAQQAMKEDLQRKQTAAKELYEQLDQQQSVKPDRVATEVQSEAKNIIAENKSYYDKHPELKPGKAWDIIKNLAENPPTTWGEMQRLRSDMMDFYRNNPEMFKGQTEAWFQRMAGALDNAMTGERSASTPEQVEAFRKANGIWKSIKETYDNPQSPYYHAIRSQTPSTMLGAFARSPEMIRSIRETVPEVQGAVQRQFFEDNIINGKDGHIDLANMNSRLGRIPEATLTEMFGAEAAKKIRIMGKVAAKVYADYKGSPTAERAIPVGEVVSALAHPVAGAVELGGQYAGAKAMNSPRVVDYLTKQRAAGRVPPKTGGVAGSEPVAPVTPEPQPPTSGATEYPDGTTHEAPPPETVGTKEGALTDTALFERARAKMPEGTPISAIAMEAQRMKVQEEAFVKQARKELGPKASMTSVMRRVQDLKDRKK
jgi:hypothetical protein